MGATQALQCLLPVLLWRDRITPDNLRADFLAGLTGAIVVLPQGVAFATIAGMPPEYGLYAGMVPAIIAALFGSSWHLVSGPTTAASIVLFSTLSALAEPGTDEYVKLALTLTFMVGVIELTLGLARLGTLVNFISHSVVVGFTAGAGILIAAKQLKHFFGVHIPRGDHLHDILIHFYHQIPHINLHVTVVSLVTLLSGLFIKRFLPRIPYMIGAMLLGSLAAYFLNLLLGEAATRITTVGALPSGLPPLSSPDLSLTTLQQLAPGAIAVTLLALTEAISIARAMAMRSGQRLDGNQEFIGQGLSNIGGAFFSGYVATGSFNRSALNFQVGAKTPLSAVFAGGLLMLIVMLVAPWAAYLPHAAMAAILFIVAYGLIDFKEIHRTLKSSGQETAVLATTFFATLFLELEFAILLGVLLSLVLYLNRTSHPTILSRVPDPFDPKRKFITAYPPLKECPQLKIIRIDGSIFFGAINHIQETLTRFEEENPEQKHLLIIANGINFLDLAGAEWLAQEAERRRAEGGGLYLCGVKEGALEMLAKSGATKVIGGHNIFPGKTAAIAEIFKRLDKDICRRCTARIFKECQTVPQEAP
ncbi:MAG: SulP family inorganic anion transporter [Gammaproteobacteria bacterium]|nr:MAG: SulP family inorganic anion transporter [Gammaproteobacteria bacterium]